MATPRQPKLTSLTALAKRLGCSRQFVSGVVVGAGLETVRGNKNSKALDPDGVAEVIRRVTSGQQSKPAGSR